MIDKLLHDLRYALRALARTPGFTTVAVLTLAIGIGASTTVFSVANWVLLRPVPGTVDPDRLVRVRMTRTGESAATFPISHPNYADLRARSTALTDLAATFDASVSLAVGDVVQPRRVDGGLVTANYFQVLGARAALGRTFAVGDGVRDEADPVAVISHRLWRDAFGSDPATIGRTVTLNGHPFTVIGVAPAGFLGDELPGTTDVWVPATTHGRILPHRGDELLADRGDGLYFEMIGRLAPGVELARAQAELRGIVDALTEAYPGENRRLARLSLVPAVTAGLGLPLYTRTRVEHMVWILAGVVGMLLLLTCANVANLLLARASRRRGELAVRQALGAGRRRLAGLVLTESTLLALAGAAVALVASLWADDLLREVQLVRGVAALGDVRPDGRVFAFAVLAAIGVAALFGAGPALAVSRQDPARHLKDGSRGSTARPLVRHGLVVAQIAISLSLVVGAGLLVRTVRGLRTEDLGYTTDRVLTFSVDVLSHGYTDQRQRDFQRALLERVRALPGVRSAGAAWLPLLGRGLAGNTLAPYGDDPGEDGVGASVNRVSPGFFAALEMPIIEGRGFRETEYPATGEPPRVAVLGERLARELFPDRSAVGQLLATRGEDTPLEVIGVAADARMRAPDREPGRMHYVPMHADFTPGWFTVYLRTNAAPTSVVAAVRGAVRELDAAVPIYDVRTLRDQVDATIAERRVVAGLSGIFALLAVLIAAVGLYGVMAYLVSERTREFGIRAALGADARSVLGLVLRQALAVTAFGLVVGVVGATQLTRLIESRLYGVTRLDPPTFAIAGAALLAAVLVASWVPAHRATRVDPMVALREE